MFPRCRVQPAVAVPLFCWCRARAPVLSASRPSARLSVARRAAVPPLRLVAELGSGVGLLYAYDEVFPLYEFTCRPLLYVVECPHLPTPLCAWSEPSFSSSILVGVGCSTSSSSPSLVRLDRSVLTPRRALFVASVSWCSASRRGVFRRDPIHPIVVLIRGFRSPFYADLVGSRFAFSLGVDLRFRVLVAWLGFGCRGRTWWCLLSYDFRLRLVAWPRRHPAFRLVSLSRLRRRRVVPRWADSVLGAVASSRLGCRPAGVSSGRIPDFPVTRSHPPASWPSAANSSICRTYRKTAGEESRRRSPVANRWMRP